MKGRLDTHQLELYKVAMLEALCLRHSITRETLDKIVDTIKEEDEVEISND